MNSFLIPANETTDQAALRKRQAVARALQGPQAMPQNVGEGIQALGTAFLNRPAAQYPTAPGGARPSFMTAMANLFTGHSNGGMY